MRQSQALALALALLACSRGGAGSQTPAPARASDASGPGPGPAVGQLLGAFEAPDQHGARQTFETLRGPNGLLLNFNRSVVW